MRKAKSKSWFSMNAGRTTGKASISIYSDIGDFGMSARDFNEELMSLGRPQELQIRISSNGGDVATGFAIYNMLERHPANKIVTVDGLAASMASVIAMAGDEIVMPSNSQIMIHNPWGGVVGESDKIMSFGEALAQMRQSIADAYVKRSGMSEADIFAMMDRETWLTAQDAVTLGFADRVEEPMKMAAQFNTSKFRNTPLAIKQMDSNWRPRTLDEIHVRAYQKWNSASKVTPT
jgi:ATP-dependent Clp protease protease subunit